MEWDELLSEFRELGGIAENVRLAEGPLGRGVFVIEPGRPATLFAPETLLVPGDSLELRDGRLTTISDAVGKRERAFFESYQSHFGWGGGGFAEAQRTQRAWSELPSEVTEFVKGMGALDHPEQRFLPPSADACLYHYVRNREFGYRGKLYLAPVVDLTNHSSSAAGHVAEGGIGVTGQFENEIVMRYNLSDAWAHAVTHGFSDRNPFAYSVEITVDARGKQLRIGRAFAQVDIRDGLLFPRVEAAGNVIALTHLMLGNSTTMDVPRAVFRKVVEPHFTAREADDIFESVRQFNHVKFINLLRTLEKYDSPHISILKEAALNQLEALSSCVGSRTL